MKIRSKLAWTYIILLIIGIITISAYSIITIRSFLLDEGITEFKNDVRSLGLAISSFESDSTLPDKVKQQALLSGYEIAVYDIDGVRFLGFPDSVFSEENQYLESSLMDSLEATPLEPLLNTEENSSKLIAYMNLESATNPAKYLRISQLKSQYYAAVASIRHIIYGGMFFSIGAVIVVSFLFARYMAQPIQQLNEAALDIARGNLDREIDLNRDDEFGTLAASLNHMAGNLKADNEQLKRLNQKQSQFFADITHEVRNPLHNIAGALEMLELENLEQEKKRSYLKTAEKQIHRINRLFEDIKALQRYDFDENFINKKEFNLTSIVEESINAFMPVAQEKGLDIQVTCPEKKTVYADPDKIEQVLDNLISNAVKYTSAGKVKVGFTNKRNEDKVEVYVEDTGPGISEEHLDRLFDRFYRTDKARSRDKGGTGLGLAVVKSILNAHKEEINIESEVGRGSRFYFSLPLTSQNKQT